MESITFGVCLIRKVMSRIILRSILLQYMHFNLSDYVLQKLKFALPFLEGRMSIKAVFDSC